MVSSRQIQKIKHGIWKEGHVHFDWDLLEQCIYIYVNNIYIIYIYIIYIYILNSIQYVNENACQFFNAEGMGDSGSPSQGVG